MWKRILDNCKRATLGLLGLAGLAAHAQGPAFGSLRDVLAYADAHSAVAQSAQAQTDLARLQSLAAMANTVNLRGNLSLSVTDNYALPVNFLPAEIFGGPAGTFRAVTFGQEFVNLASLTPQLDLVAPSAWARVGSARAATALTEANNAVSRRNQHEALATAYCNYYAVAGQLALARAIVQRADTIVMMANERLAQGLLRQQDLNNAQVNRLNLADFQRGLEVRLAQLQLQLQALLGLPAEQAPQLAAAGDAGVGATGLQARSGQLGAQAMRQVDLQRHELLSTRLNFLPTVSLVAGFNWQQNSNEGVINSADWIASRYIGLRINMPLPTEPRIWSQAEEYRINLRLKEINAAQVQVQERMQNAQINLDADRAYASFETTEQIRALKTENYANFSRLYTEGLISLDQLLTAFTDLLNAEMAEENARWNLSLQLARIHLYAE